VGYWSGLDELSANWREGRRWSPELGDAERQRLDRNWKKAVTKTLNWVDADVL
jgi:glycerol kinase